LKAHVKAHALSLVSLAKDLAGTTFKKVLFLFELAQLSLHLWNLGHGEFAIARQRFFQLLDPGRYVLDTSVSGLRVAHIVLISKFCCLGGYFQGD
jgi:hypothetical protein